MATWDTQDEYYSGQGIILLAARDVNGNPTGFFPVGNCPDLKISVSTTTVEHKESKTGQRGIDLRLTTETKATLAMTLENFNSENLARVSRGLSTDVTGAAVVGAAIKARLGKIVGLPYIKISAVTVHNGVTPLVAGTDYWVNADAGSIKFANTISGVTDGADLTIDYTYASQTLIDGLTTGAQEFYMRFEGLNSARSNEPVVIDIFKFSVDPFKELALIGDNVQSFVLEGSVLADSLRASGSKYFLVRKLG